MAKPKTKKATASESVTPDLTIQAPRQANQRFMLLAALGIVVFFAIYLLRLDRTSGMFMDDASPATDFIHWILGKPVSVMAEIENTLTDVAPAPSSPSTSSQPRG